MNHLLQDAQTGSPNEYNEIEETMSPTALKIIADWVISQTGRRNCRQKCEASKSYAACWRICFGLRSAM